MKLLLDTNVVIWMFMFPEAIPNTIAKAMHEADEIGISIISILEIGIKMRKGKLAFSHKPHEIHDVVVSRGMRFLNLDPEIGTMLVELPLHHNDPFDRMLIAQAIRHGMTLASTDRHFRNYGVKLAS